MNISIYQAIRIFVSTVVLASLLDMFITQGLNISHYSNLLKYKRSQRTRFSKLFESIVGDHTLDFIYSRTLFFPLAELMFGTSVVLSVYSVGFGWLLLPRIIFAILFVLLLIVPLSLEHTTTPNIITWSGIILGIVTSLVTGIHGLISSILGAFLGFAILFFFYKLGELVSKLAGQNNGEAMGGGVVYAMAMTGAFCGYPGIIIAIFIATISGGLVSLAYILYRRIIGFPPNLTDELPYAPFMVVGGAIVIYILPLLPSSISEWFLRLL